METALMDGLAWTLICGIWIFVGFGLRHSLRELAQLSGRKSGVVRRRMAARGLAYA